MVTWYWSADTLFWQVSVDHNMDLIPKKYTVNQGCMSLCQPVIWSMAAMLRDSVVVLRTRPRAIPLAMITMRKSTHGFPFVSHIWVAYGAPLGGPWGRQSSAMINCLLSNQVIRWPVPRDYIVGSSLWLVEVTFLLKLTADQVLVFRLDRGLTSGKIVENRAVLFGSLLTLIVNQVITVSSIEILFCVSGPGCSKAG